MKNLLCFVCGALAGITIPQFTAFAETTKPNSTTAAPATTSAPLANGLSSGKIAKECEDEWRAHKEAMMRRGIPKERYVEQCSVKDDVPTIPSETEKTNAPPSSAPK